MMWVDLVFPLRMLCRMWVLMPAIVLIDPVNLSDMPMMRRVLVVLRRAAVVPKLLHYWHDPEDPLRRVDR